MQKKIITVLSGLPGTGKSTLSKNYIENGSAYCSADSYFINDYGEYNWDQTKIGHAHQTCKMDCELFCQAAYQSIVVDNTSLTFKEISPYCAIAEKYGYGVNIIRTDCDVYDTVLAERNLHGVSVEVIKRMRDKMQPLSHIQSKIKEIYPGMLIE